MFHKGHATLLIKQKQNPCFIKDKHNIQKSKTQFNNVNDIVRWAAGPAEGSTISLTLLNWNGFLSGFGFCIGIGSREIGFSWAGGSSGRGKRGRYG